MKIEASIIRLRDGQLSPFVQSCGRWYCIETKPSLVALGVSVMQPVGADWREDWAAPVAHTAAVPADEADSRAATTFEHSTRDPGILALARKFNQLAEDDQLVAGPFSAS